MADADPLLQREGSGKLTLAAKATGTAGFGTVTPRLLVSVVLATLGAFQYGWHVAVLNTPQKVIKDAMHAGDFMWAAVVALFAVGGFIGTQLAAPLADHLGRARGLTLNSTMFIVTGALQFCAGQFASSSHTAAYALLLVGRLTAGIGCGIATVIVPMYLSEVASRNMRGMFGSLNQFAVVVAILVVEGVGIVMGSPALYKWLLALTAGLGGVQLLGGPSLLESPSWLAKHRGREPALDVLLAARGYSMVDAEAELREIQAAAAASAGIRSPSVWALLASPAFKAMRWPLLIACTLQLTQQLSGINAVFFYSTSFFAGAGVDNPTQASVMVAGVNVVATGAAVYLMERAGRRNLLLSGTSGMLASTLALVGVLAFKDGSVSGVSVDSGVANALAIVFVLAFVSFFEVGLGAIPWQIGGEIFPEAPRATGMGIAAAVNWAGTFTVGLVFPTMQSAIKQYAFLPFAAVLATSLVFQIAYIPETRSRTLMQIQAALRSSAPACIGGGGHRSSTSSFEDGVLEAVHRDDLVLNGGLGHRTSAVSATDSEAGV